MAHAMGADFIEQDVVLTRDRSLIVLHDLFLDAVTDVADRFPDRCRDDGRHYAIDFDLKEIRTLRVNERRQTNGKAAFPSRFPVDSNIFRVPTLDEEIILIQGMNQSTGRDTGLYIEPKSPAWHLREGADIMKDLLTVLSHHGYHSRSDKVRVQSFDDQALKRARNDLKTELTLVQLIGDNSWRESDTDFDYLLTDAGLREVSSYADGIGPWLLQVVQFNGPTGQAGFTSLVEQAHQHGLFVHAYTLRSDQLPKEMNDFDQALRFLLEHSGLDGIFTDFPDRITKLS
jgi:glycerophosphoryl diester phosphodiesterase